MFWILWPGIHWPSKLRLHHVDKARINDLFLLLLSRVQTSAEFRGGLPQQPSPLQ